MPAVVVDTSATERCKRAREQVLSTGMSDGAGRKVVKTLLHAVGQVAKVRKSNKVAAGLIGWAVGRHGRVAYHTGNTHRVFFSRGGCTVSLC